MTPSRFFPATPGDSINKWMDSLFNTTLAQVMGSDYTFSSPSVNVIEHDDRFEMHLAAPGLEKADFNIEVENGFLVISAEKKSESEEAKGKFTRKEFNYHSFKRSFQIDDLIEQEKISATYENGVLNLTLPKKAETWKKANGRTIEIQ